MRIPGPDSCEPRCLGGCLAKFGNWRLALFMTGCQWLGAQEVECYQIDQILLLGPPLAHTYLHSYYILHTHARARIARVLLLV